MTDHRAAGPDLRLAGPAALGADQAEASAGIDGILLLVAVAIVLVILLITCRSLQLAILFCGVGDYALLLVLVALAFGISQLGTNGLTDEESFAKPQPSVAAEKKLAEHLPRCRTPARRRGGHRVLLDTIIVRSVLVTALNLDVGRHVWWPSCLALKEDVREAEPDPVLTPA